MMPHRAIRARLADGTAFAAVALGLAGVLLCVCAGAVIDVWLVTVPAMP